MTSPLYAQSTTTPYVISDEEKALIKAAIDIDEITELALTLGNIHSTSGEEAEAASYVHNWLQDEGFKTRTAGAVPHRENVIGEYGGQGLGKNLLFTAHLDTESPSADDDINRHKYSPETLANPEWKQCWLDDGKFHGFPISNDRGPMSCFLIAAKALKKAGIKLSGKLYLTACPGEIGPEPMEEWRGIDYMGKDIGAHYLFHHGGVVADYAIAAEGCDWGVTWQGNGYALFRIQLLGEGVFTPILEADAETEKHPNPIYQLGKVIDALHLWSQTYEKANTYTTAGGVSVPKVQIDSIKAGSPLTFGAGTDVCSLYIEVGLTAQQTANDAYHELNQLMSTLGLKGYDIEPVVVRNGFEADATQVAPLVKSLCEATQSVKGQPIERAHPAYSSMWRDHNVFNMQRIPAVTSGMPRWRPTPQDLVDSAFIYALTALQICGRAD
jgi:acetylornithine deacetylase/succinyl-diaminopimelate desuccinylase-like protein